MKIFYRQLILTITAVSIYSISIAQLNTQNELLKTFDYIRSKNLTSAKTNVLSEILQASINNGIISGNGSDINIKSTIFQLKKIWNPDITIDSNYIKESFSRNFEFGIGFKIKDDYKINGIGASFKYAIINNRDITRHDLPGLSIKTRELNHDIENALIVIATHITDKIDRYKRSLLADPLGIDAEGMTIKLTPQQRVDSMTAENKTKYDKINSELIAFGPVSNTPNALHQLGVNLGNSLLNEMGMSLNDFDAIKYGEVIQKINEKATAIDDEIKKRALLTLSFGSNYINNIWDSLNIKLEYLKGLGNKEDKDKPWDIYAAAFYDFKMDATLNKALNRQIFTGKLGLNKVLIKNQEKNTSFLEILGAAELNYLAKGAGVNEKKTVFMADFTLTFRLSPTIFLPVEFKYEPNEGNVFGFLKVKWDLPRTTGKE